MVLVADRAGAVEFVITGPRAVGMGGAGVAVTSDALATYWNPAGLTMSTDADIRIQGSAQAIDRGMIETLDAIGSIDITDISLSNAATLQSLLNQFNSSSGSVLGSAGAYFKGHWGDQAFGVNVSDVATGGLFAADPLTVTISGGNLAVNGSLRANALEARQINFSYAYAFADRTFSLGVTSKIIQGAAYASNVAVFDASSGHFEIRSDLGQAKISTQFGIDVGAVFQPASWFRLGIVAKDINEPTFDAPDGSKFKLVPQVRAGLGLNPYESLTIAFDADLTSNPTLVPNVKSQVLSLGAEHTLLSKTIALRLGALKNVKDAQSSLTGTAGLGLRVLALQIDLGGGYDFNTQGTLIAGSVGLTF